MTCRAAFCTSESFSKLPSAQRSRSPEKKDFLKWLNREYISLLISCYQMLSRVIKIMRLRTLLLLMMIPKDFWWEFFDYYFTSKLIIFPQIIPHSLLLFSWRKLHFFTQRHLSLRVDCQHKQHLWSKAGHVGCLSDGIRSWMRAKEHEWRGLTSCLYAFNLKKC